MGCATLRIISDALPVRRRWNPPETSETMDLPPWLLQGINSYGYWVVLLAVAIESTGIPFPGETTLVAAAVYASTQHTLSITLVIVAAATGAILGDNAGYTIGRYGGYPLLRRILHLLHIGEDKLLYTQRYFAKHGDKTVFFGRFLAVLRAWAAFLAGANHMPRRVFILWNAAGGILWATIYGLLGFILGNNLPLLGRILKGLGIFGFVVVGVIVVAALTVMLACADFVPSATLVAFTVAVVVELTCGAVNNPLEETDPRFVLQVTPVLLVLLTDAVSCLVPPD